MSFRMVHKEPNGPPKCPSLRGLDFERPRTRHILPWNLGVLSVPSKHRMLVEPNITLVMSQFFAAGLQAFDNAGKKNKTSPRAP